MNPKSLMVVRRSPEKRYFLVSLKLSEEPGSLSQVSKTLAVRDLNVLEGYTCPVSKSGNAVWSFIVESKNPRMDTKFLKELLGNTGFVDEMEIKESDHGLIIDSVNFPVKVGEDTRAIIFVADYVSKAFKAVSDRFGADGAEVIYQMGFVVGQERQGLLFPEPVEDPRKLLEASLELAAATGMGRASLKEYNTLMPMFKISLEDSFECLGRSSDRPVSNFMRGLFGGTLAAVFEGDFHCREVHCIARGDKNCFFEVTRSTGSA
jgi:predicted hydrocarbon binding protein